MAMPRRRRARLFIAVGCTIVLAIAVLVVDATHGGLHWDTRDPGRISVADGVRRLALGAPAGKYAYWLGAQFRGAPVAGANAGWGEYALLGYYRTAADGTVDTDFDVRTYPGAHEIDAGIDRSQLRIHTRRGQDVIVVFRTPAHPSAAFLRAVRNALRPIPRDVQVTG